MQYLDILCENMDRVTDENKDIFLLCDFNIDWLLKNCSLAKKLRSMADVCNLTQLITQPTRISTKVNNVSTSSCIDLIFTNNQELCSKAVSVAVGCSDHNLIAITKRQKFPNQELGLYYPGHIKDSTKICSLMMFRVCSGLKYVKKKMST